MNCDFCVLLTFTFYCSIVRNQTEENVKRTPSEIAKFYKYSRSISDTNSTSELKAKQTLTNERPSAEPPSACNGTSGARDLRVTLREGGDVL